MTATASIAGVDVSPLHFIDGARVGSDATFTDISPIDEAPLAEVARGAPVEVDAAVDAARAAFPAWAKLGAEGRADHLFASPTSSRRTSSASPRSKRSTTARCSRPRDFGS